MTICRAEKSESGCTMVQHWDVPHAGRVVAEGGTVADGVRVESGIPGPIHSLLASEVALWGSGQTATSSSFQRDCDQGAMRKPPLLMFLNATTSPVRTPCPKAVRRSVGCTTTNNSRGTPVPGPESAYGLRTVTTGSPSNTGRPSAVYPESAFSKDEGASSVLPKSSERTVTIEPYRRMEGSCPHKRGRGGWRGGGSALNGGGKALNSSASPAIEAYWNRTSLMVRTGLRLEDTTRGFFASWAVFSAVVLRNW